MRTRMALLLAILVALATGCGGGSDDAATPRDDSEARPPVLDRTATAGDAEEEPEPAAVDSYLTDLEQLGVFEAAAGLVIGRPYGYDEEACATLWRVVEERTRDAALPVLGDVDCGHTDPMLTLPIGARAVLDAGARTFRTLEPATA
jgi:hypothetical protein